MTHIVRNLPLNPNIALDGLASQETGLGTFQIDNLQTTSILPYVSQIQTPVTYTRNSQAVTHNPVTGNITLREVDEPAFGDLGIQVGPAKDNVLSNSDFRDGTVGYTTVDAGPVITLSTTEDSGLSESDQALRLTMVNSTGFAQTVSVYQSTTGLINEFWTAQGRYQILSFVGNPSALFRIYDNTNAQITSSNPLNLDLTGRYHQESATQQLVGNSADLRWELFVTLANGEELDLRVTNTQMVISPWRAHYVPSTIGPTTRDADTVDISTSSPEIPLVRFFTHAPDEMWSISLKTLGQLTTLAGANQLQYIFSSYDGVDGTSLFVDDPNTLTWRADFNGSFEDVTLSPIFGNTEYRLFFRILTNGGSFDRQLFAEDLLTGTIVASSVLTTPNLPVVGDLFKLGRDNADANYFDGFIGGLTFWDYRTNATMQRINSNWPT